MQTIQTRRSNSVSCCRSCCWSCSLLFCRCASLPTAFCGKWSLHRRWSTSSCLETCEGRRFDEHMETKRNKGTRDLCTLDATLDATLIESYWPPVGCERQKSTVQFPLYIRKLGACPKQVFLPSTLSGEVFYFMLLLDSLEFAGRYCLGKTAFVEFTWQPHFQQLLLQLPLLHLPSEQPDTPCTSSIHMASNVRPANAATICSYHQSPHQTWPDILG